MDDYGTENRLVEIYNPTSKSWSINYDSSRTYTYCVGSEFVASCPGAGSPCYGGTNNAPSPWLSLYPRIHLMPSGLLVTVGQRASGLLTVNGMTLARLQYTGPLGHQYFFPCKIVREEQSAPSLAHKL